MVLAILSGFPDIPQKYFSRIYRCYKLGQIAGSTSRSKNLERDNQGP